jgi:ectoine hydroxylase-related dioxygenase (phytanoyl-CoA dioxygenase family)
MAEISESEHASNGVNGRSNGVVKPATMSSAISSRLYALSRPPSLSAFATLCSQVLSPSKYPLASSIQSNVPVYQLPAYSKTSASCRSALQDEWNHILLSGPGVFVTKSLFPSTSPIQSANAAFSQIISAEKAANGAKKGDHFAAAGTNDRIWNSFSKHCLVSPSSFIAYYSNPWLPIIAESWLGPAYRVTAQVNVVKPGGAAQVSHRDYHLGFQSERACAAFPKALQVASQFLTLQGAVAHSAMPLESGPTRLLPFSQQFDEGYMAYRRPEFTAFFLDSYVALPLDEGDGLFFNPALFHAAGENVTEGFERWANLLQISSAFGKTMETIDGIPLVEACWEGLREMFEANGLDDEIMALVKALGDGYPFPTNLDRRPPRPDGMAPESEQDILIRCLEERKSKYEVLEELKKMRKDAMA